MRGIPHSPSFLGASQVALVAKMHIPVQEVLRGMGLIPGSGDHLEEDTATHSAILAWRKLRMEEPGVLQSIAE